MTSKIQDISKKYALIVLLCIACIVFNVGGVHVMSRFNVPLWMDSVGALVAGFYAGPVGAIAVSFTTSMILGIYNPAGIVFTLVRVATAVAGSFAIRKGAFEKFSSIVAASLAVGYLCSIIAVPMNFHLFGGQMGNYWGDALYELLKFLGINSFWSCVIAEIFIEVFDKQVCFLIAFFIVKMIKKPSFYSKKSKKSTSIIAAFLALTMLLPFAVPQSVSAEVLAYENNYSSVIYDRSNGLVASNASSVTGALDGNIWIGGDNGITIYNGSTFTFVDNQLISGVTALYCDKLGRIWIGMNEGGIARYEDGSYKIFSEKKGIEESTINCFAEDITTGEIYVGTSNGSYIFSELDQIYRMRNNGNNIVDIAIKDSVAYMVNADGLVISFSNKTEIGRSNGNVDAKCIALTRKKEIMVGDSLGNIYDVVVGGRKIELKKRNTVDLTNINNIVTDKEGRLWIGADDGFGFFDDQGRFLKQGYSGFNGNIEQIYEDYQGNVWIASSREGLLKLSHSKYVDLFDSAGISSVIVNAVSIIDNKIYCGTNQGLIILDKETMNVLKDDLSEYIEYEKIQAILLDSDNNIWVGTGNEGLIKYSPDNSITKITIDDGLLAKGVKCLLEGKDGKIVAGTEAGINIIDKDLNVSCVYEDRGKLTSSINCLSQDEDGFIYAGTESEGFYMIKSGRIISNASTDKGLSSKSVLKMVPYNGGFFIVTANGICFTKNGAVNKLRGFPYPHNYDLLIYNNSAYVCSSAGIYEVDVRSLVSGMRMNYKLDDDAAGFYWNIVGDSQNMVDEDGTIYLCTSEGVTAIYQEDNLLPATCMFSIEEVYADNILILPEDDTYVIPERCNEVLLYPAVKNYSNDSFYVSFYVKELTEEPEIISQRDLSPLMLTNLSKGEYQIRMNLYDSQGNRRIKSQTWRLIKEPRIWEHPWFLVFVICVGVEIIALTIYELFSLFLSRYRKRAMLESNLKKEIETKNIIEEKTRILKEDKNRKELLLEQTTEALSSTVDAKDKYTKGRSKRTAEYARLLAIKAGYDEEMQHLAFIAGLLYDVGKIRIDEAILNKPGKLSEAEMESVRIHPVIGYNILKKISEEPLLAKAAKYHHERFDGTGYPDKLKGENIPEIARLIAVVDAYEAMTTKRSYRKAMSQPEVYGEIEKYAGTQFDPRFASLMLEIIREDTDYKLRERVSEKMNVLIIDDSKMELSIAKRILENEPGMRIYTAESGVEGIGLVHKEAIDIVLLDIEMPKMNGFETLTKIREISNIPIIFITGNRDAATIKHAEEMGVENYITKPFYPSNLLETIQGVIRN